jgi:hypothetical protein
MRSTTITKAVRETFEWFLKILEVENVAVVKLYNADETVQIILVLVPSRSLIATLYTVLMFKMLCLNIHK